MLVQSDENISIFTLVKKKKMLWNYLERKKKIFLQKSVLHQHLLMPQQLPFEPSIFSDFRFIRLKACMVVQWVAFPLHCQGAVGDECPFLSEFSNIVSAPTSIMTRIKMNE